MKNHILQKVKNVKTFFLLLDLYEMVGRVNGYEPRY
jgi:hypothetical protein